MGVKGVWAPHLAFAGAKPPEYEVVVPTYQRWKPTQDVAKRRRKHVQNCSTPFILEHTLAFLGAQGVPRQCVTLFVADRFEEQQYRAALQGSIWADVRIVVSAPGIRNSRNFICQYFAEGTHVVSIDDDVELVMWKFRAGDSVKSLRPLPLRGFEGLISDADRRMRQHGAFLWGVNTSRNPGFMSHKIVSVRNGLVNGYLHGFLARPGATDLLRQVGDAVDDAEFSVRNFAKDGVVLRYRMYMCKTRPYLNGGGLQTEFPEPASRKRAEREGAAKLHELFPRLIGLGLQREEIETMEVRFLHQPKGRKSVVLKRVPKRKLCAGMDGKAKEPEKTSSNQQTSSSLQWYRFSLEGKDRIAYIPNPKCPGSSAHRRYKAYCQAKTVSEALRRGANKNDFRYDFEKGFLVVTNLWTQPHPRADRRIGKDRRPPQPKCRVGKGTLDCSVRTSVDGCLALGVALSGHLWDRLWRRCPALRDKVTAGLRLGRSPLAVLRVLLHWAETGQLAFRKKDGPALMCALQNAGAAAEKRQVAQLLGRLPAEQAKETASQGASQRRDGRVKSEPKNVARPGTLSKKPRFRAGVLKPDTKAPA